MTKENFCSIIRELEAAESLQNKVATAVRQYNNLVHNDYPEPFGMVISHEFTVINLLEEIMGDKDGTISYFCIELDFGKTYHPGCVQQDGEDVDISTAEKLYDVLEEDRNRKKFINGDKI